MADTDRKATGTRSSGTLAVFGVAVLANLLLSIFLLDQVRLAREQIGALEGKLATKQDVAMLRPIRISEILEERCEGCHTDRRFKGLAAMSQTEVLATIYRMRSHPGANIPGDQVDEIEAALLVFRCTSCHSEAVLSKLALMPRDERVRFLRTKVAMPNSGFRVDQVSQLIGAFELLAGAARR
jgi:hypothetical protein